jgi:hypothetical protein
MQARKLGLNDHWLKAIQLGNEYRYQKLMGAPHHKLHNLDRQMKFHLKKVEALKKR